MPIKDRLQLVINQIIDERNSTEHSETAGKLKERAAAAILKGQRTPEGGITDEWHEYMRYVLVATEEEGTPADPVLLARLLPTDGSEQDKRQKERAYLTANGMCGTPTTDTMLDGTVTDELDKP